MVAIALAASFMPLRKSNANAIRIRPISSGNASVATSIAIAIRPASGVLDDDAVHHVGNVVETVNDLFEVVIHFVANEKGQRVAAAGAVGPVQLVEAAVVHLV